MSERGVLPADSNDDADAALRDVRARFIARLTSRRAQLEDLICSAIHPGATAAAESLRHFAHQLVGLAGTVGFPSVSREAVELERLAIALQQGSAVPIDDARAAVASVYRAFAADMAAAEPVWSPRGQRAGSVAVLVVEDDDDQFEVTSAVLRSANHSVSRVVSGGDVLAAARAQEPALILLDVDLPDLDGFSVCRQLKADPLTAKIPLVFVSAQGELAHRTAGLALGADEYITKPFEPSELLLRITRTLSRAGSSPPAVSGNDAQRQTETARTGAVLEYDAFIEAVQHARGRGLVTVALVRVPRGALDSVAVELLNELRRIDIVGRYSDIHLTVLMPEVSDEEACRRLESVIGRLAAGGIERVTVGVASDAAGDSRSAEALVAAADDALAAARVAGSGVVSELDAANASPQRGAAAGRVLIADDDPDILHIIDPQLRASGFTTSLAVDGKQTWDAIERDKPDVVLLDLMMPKLTGFDILGRVGGLDDPPAVIVLSGRGREEDVTRAFDLGADDYLTKPFNPKELVARITRLLR